MSAIDISVIPFSTVLILLITFAVSLINMIINRVLVSRMVGWDQYRAMQKEIAEHRSQTMKAVRANDKKTIEKLKRKDAQINQMQMKMSKPQMLLLPISFIYILIWWFFLNPTYITPEGIAIHVAIVPGIGGIPVLYWYMLCSFMFGTLVSKMLGVTPIE
jgi:uncharacterized membrane protein (DUF106 family)